MLLVLELLFGELFLDFFGAPPGDHIHKFLLLGVLLDQAEVGPGEAWLLMLVVLAAAARGCLEHGGLVPDGPARLRLVQSRV